MAARVLVVCSSVVCSCVTHCVVWLSNALLSVTMWICEIYHTIVGLCPGGTNVCPTQHKSQTQGKTKKAGNASKKIPIKKLVTTDKHLLVVRLKLKHPTSNRMSMSKTWERSSLAGVWWCGLGPWWVSWVGSSEGLKVSARKRKKVVLPKI